MKWDARASQAQREAAARYDAEHTRRIALKLNTRTDADILAYLDSAKAEPGGMQGLIKRLIREDMTKTKEGNGNV